MKDNTLWHNVPPVSIARRVIERIRDEMDTRDVTQRDLASRMHCSQGKVAKVLNGRMTLTMKDAETMAEAVGLTVCEAVRDRGLEFYAEMTPIEVRILERLRQRPETALALLTLLDIKDVTKHNTLKRKVGRPLDSARIKEK